VTSSALSDWFIDSDGREHCVRRCGFVAAALVRR
jgi:hypothetical protein